MPKTSLPLLSILNNIHRSFAQIGQLFQKIFPDNLFRALTNSPFICKYNKRTLRKMKGVKK